MGLEGVLELGKVGSEGDAFDSCLVIMLDERARVRQLDMRDLLRGVDVQGIFFTCSIYVCSRRDSFMFIVEFDKLLELSSRCNEVLFLPEVVEQV